MIRFRIDEALFGIAEARRHIVPWIRRLSWRMQHVWRGRETARHVEGVDARELAGRVRSFDHNELWS